MIILSTAESQRISPRLMTDSATKHTDRPPPCSSSCRLHLKTPSLTILLSDIKVKVLYKSESSFSDTVSIAPPLEMTISDGYFITNSPCLLADHCRICTVIEPDITNGLSDRRSYELVAKRPTDTKSAEPFFGLRHTLSPITSDCSFLSGANSYCDSGSKFQSTTWDSVSFPNINFNSKCCFIASISDSIVFPLNVSFPRRTFISWKTPGKSSSVANRSQIILPSNWDLLNIIS